jgi:hypothetical protein
MCNGHISDDEKKYVGPYSAAVNSFLMDRNIIRNEARVGVLMSRFRNKYPEHIQMYYLSETPADGYCICHDLWQGSESPSLCVSVQARKSIFPDAVITMKIWAPMNLSHVGIQKSDTNENERLITVRLSENGPTTTIVFKEYARDTLSRVGCEDVEESMLYAIFRSDEYHIITKVLTMIMQPAIQKAEETEMYLSDSETVDGDD